MDNSHTDDLSHNDDVALRLGVSPEIHHDDMIFQFLLSHPLFPTKAKAVDEYFNDGLDSALKLQAVLRDNCGIDGKDRISLLEFASGYGRVTRHLKNVIPYCATTSCDIHEQAVQFIQQKLLTDAVLSTTRPEDLNLERKFDVVFALSFFSHMPKISFGPWLEKLASFVKDGGYLIFTTHGLVSPPKDKLFDKDGFYFRYESDQKDISTKDYGTAYTAPWYVFVEALKIPGFAPTHFHEAYWWGHQDIYVLKNNT